MTNYKHLIALLLGASIAGASQLSAQEPAKDVRTIKLLQDDAQVRYARFRPAKIFCPMWTS